MNDKAPNETSLLPCPFCGEPPGSNDTFVWCFGIGNVQIVHNFFQVERGVWNSRALAAVREGHETTPKPNSPPAVSPKAADTQATPRTDAAEYDTGLLRSDTCDWKNMVVAADFARTLERKLAEAGQQADDAIAHAERFSQTVIALSKAAGVPPDRPMQEMGDALLAKLEQKSPDYLSPASTGSRPGGEGTARAREIETLCAMIQRECSEPCGRLVRHIADEALRAEIVERQRDSWSDACSEANTVKEAQRERIEQLEGERDAVLAESERLQHDLERHMTIANEEINRADAAERSRKELIERCVKAIRIFSSEYDWRSVEAMVLMAASNRIENIGRALRATPQDETPSS